MSHDKLKSFVCTHCGKRFEAEERDGLECPGCFWSSTVHPAGEAPPQEAKEKPVFEPASKPTLPLKPLMVIICGLLLAAALGFGLMKLIQSVPAKKPVRIVPEKTLKEKEPLQEVALTQEELEKLQKSVEIPAQIVMSAKQKGVFENRVPFKTGIVEKLPSQIWKLEAFEKLLENQGERYGVPLSKRYRKKLVENFEENYVPSQSVFIEGDILGARNLWVKSLVFPIYDNDLQKHRGVVLTMLRPFINDTLSKIGAANAVLADRQLKNEEAQIHNAYAQVFDLIHQKRWQDASGAIQKALSEITQFENLLQQKTFVPPPYPSEISQVDAHIIQTLQALYGSYEPSFADLLPIKEDLLAKQKALSELNPDFLKENAERYRKALVALQNENWDSAAKFLKEIKGPEILRSDAEEKLTILKNKKSIS